MLRLSRSSRASFSCSRCSFGESAGSSGPAVRPTPTKSGATLVTTSFAPNAWARSAARSRARRAGSVSSNPTTIVFRGLVMPGTIRLLLESDSLRNVDAQLFLGGRDCAERLAQVQPREGREIPRIDQVVGVPVRLDARRVVVEANPRDHLERLAQGDS